MEKKNSSNRPWKAEFGGIAKSICMSEVRNFAEIAPNTERTLRPKASQGSDEVDGNPVHLLRYPYSKRGADGGQDRAES